MCVRSTCAYLCIVTCGYVCIGIYGVRSSNPYLATPDGVCNKRREAQHVLWAPGAGIC